jgi:hypothetical protein
MTHPEKAMSPAAQAMIQVLFGVKVRKHRIAGMAEDDAAELAMWEIFALIDNPDAAEDEQSA